MAVAMAEEQQKGGRQETLIGIAALIVIILFLGSVGYLVYAKFLKPVPVTVSISAYFVDDSGEPVNAPDSPGYAQSHIKVQGSVYQGEKPVSNGTVRISISTSNEAFRQSVSVPLKDGRFEAEDPAFHSVHPGDPVAITADVSAPGLTQTTAVHLNSQAAVSRTPIIVISGAIALLMLVIFCYAFTGRKTPWKNRTAIIFSYLVILLFLGLPIIAPMVLLQYFPDAVGNMIGAPAGLIKTNTASLPKNETQWALNIGGYSFVPNQDSGAAGSAAAAASTIPHATPNPAVSGDADTSATLSAAASSSKPSQPSDLAATTTTTAPTPRQKNVGTEMSPKLIPQTAADIPVVDVHGGLVIPLYVIVLSAIGGAINMTRKVPVFQREGEESDFIPERPISSLGSRVMRFFGSTPVEAAAAATATVPALEQQPTQAGKAEVPLEQQADEIEAELQELVTMQIQRNCETDQTLSEIRNLVEKMQGLYKARTDDKPLLKFSSFEDWAASHARVSALLRGSWWVELLNQYMYLISAPFLAIVTYYILDLLGLTKQGHRNHLA